MDDDVKSAANAMNDRGADLNFEVSVVEGDELEDGLMSPKVRDTLMGSKKTPYGEEDKPARPVGLCGCLSLAYYQPQRRVVPGLRGQHGRMGVRFQPPRIGVHASGDFLARTADAYLARGQVLPSAHDAALPRVSLRLLVHHVHPGCDLVRFSDRRYGLGSDVNGDGVVALLPVEQPVARHLGASDEGENAPSAGSHQWSAHDVGHPHEAALLLKGWTHSWCACITEYERSLFYV
ncbi:hypothetical protein ON010_g12395 [Phytophthora cinnamomi]|nr:hypothetical protein ON010_g12395 [Phytophthora cinnamomi]